MDVGDEERQLDFVITDEEMGVVERDFDHIAVMNSVLDDDEEQIEIESIDDAETQSVFVSEPEPGSEEIGAYVTEDETEDYIIHEEVEEEELPPLGYSEEIILELEDELENESDEDNEASSAIDMDTFSSGYEEDYPNPEQRTADADVVADLGLLDDEMISPSTRMLLNDEIEMNISLEDDILEADKLAEQTAELDIDWAKEAANIPDISIESDPGSRASDDLSPSIHLKEDVGLKPAEELLSQLNLDDLDDEPLTSSRANKNPFDIPLIDDEEVSPRGSRREDRDEMEEQPVPAEDVIRQYGDLTKLINSSEQKKYAKRLFGRNEDTIKHALAVLNGKPTWREASEYIDELFIKHDVDMYSKIAVQFTDDIYKRYLARK